MTAENACQSCSMPIESGPYCKHCTNPQGHLIDFEECVQRFLQWTRRNEPTLADRDARRKTLQFMAKMPAWKDHPDVLAANRT